MGFTAFFDACVGIFERYAFRLLDGGTEKAVRVGGVDFKKGFGEDAGVSHEVVEYCAEGDRGAIRAGDTRMRNQIMRESESRRCY